MKFIVRKIEKVSEYHADIIVYQNSINADNDCDDLII